MARVFVDGWEHGGIALWDAVVSGANVENAGTYDMDGNYCLYLYLYEYVQKTISANNEYYFAFLYRPTTSSTNRDVFSVFSGATRLCDIKRDTTTNVLYARVGGITKATSTSIIVANIVFLIEVYIKIDDTVGRFVVKINGITDIDFTGDTKPGADTTIDGARLGYFDYGCNAYFDNFICDNASWIGETKIQAIVPTAAGNATNWTPSAGSNYDCVEEKPPSDVDYVSTNTVNLIDTYTTGDLTGTIDEIKCVQVQARTAFDATPTPLNINLVARSGGTDYFSGDIAVPAAYKELNYLWEADPATAVAWIEAGVNALQIGIKSKA